MEEINLKADISHVIDPQSGEFEVNVKIWSVNHTYGRNDDVDFECVLRTKEGVGMLRSWLKQMINELNDFQEQLREFKSTRP